MVAGSLLGPLGCSSGAESGTPSQFGDSLDGADADTGDGAQGGQDDGGESGGESGGATGGSMTGQEPGGEATGETGGEGEDEPGRFPGRDRDDGDHGAKNGYCDAVADWDSGWAAYELEIVERLNSARASGGDCGALGKLGPAPALAVDPALACAARVHAGDMASRDYFDHASPEGEQPEARLTEAGFTGGLWAENIGAGFPTPSAAVTGWMKSDQHCANILSPDFVGVGVGYAFGPESTYAHYWALVLGGP